ncbi:MAG: hypothetical protein CMF45_05865 [Legionellales bacterium]|nr:hypothetical protein [Legionellales bacterium]
MKLHWQNDLNRQEEPYDKRLHDLLFQNGSLSRSIEKICNGTFNIELKNESWSTPMSDENDLLALIDNEITFIRKSWLKCNDKRLVYARTIIPRITYEEESKNLMKLGNKPLGDLLFNNNRTYRTNMQYAKIPLHHDLHKQATLDTNIMSELWGRQSLFYIHKNPLLVTEVFLPTLFGCT